MNGEQEQADAAEGFVDALLRSARESATRTTDGIDAMGQQVGELGGAVAKLAGVVERMAVTVQQTKGDADDTKHAVGAADWFWRRVKGVLADHRKKWAGGLAALCFGFGNGPVGQTVISAPSNDGESAVRAAMAGGRWADADRLLAGGVGMSNAERLWLRCQVRKGMGDTATAAHLLRMAAAAGHPDAAFICRRTGSS